MRSLLHPIRLGKDLVQGSKHLVMNELFINLARWCATITLVTRLVALVITRVRRNHALISPLLRVFSISFLVQDQISSRLRGHNHLPRTLTHKLMHLWLFRLMRHPSLLAHVVHDDSLLCLLPFDTMLDKMSL